MEKTKAGNKMGRLLKKAQTPVDVFMIVVFLFALVIAAMIGTYWYNEFVDKAKTVEAINSTQEAVKALEAGQTVNAMWDYLIFIVFIGLAISIIIVGYFLDVSSVFLPLFIIALVVGVLLSGALSYIWGTIEAQEPFATIQSSFPITTHLLDNLTLYFSILGAIAMIVNYAKTRDGT